MSEDKKLEPTNIEVTWLSDSPGNLQDVFVGVVDEVKVGLIQSPKEARGILLAFPSSKDALLFRGAAAEELLKTIDTLLHDDVEWSSEELDLEESSSSPAKKVTLH